MSKRPVNKYVPEYVPSNLKWFERDELLTYIDELKYSKFSRDPDKYLKEVEVLNFDMIHARCRDDKQSVTDKQYQTVASNDLKNMSQKGKKKDVSACIRSNRKDLFVEKKLSFDHFRELLKC